MKYALLLLISISLSCKTNSTKKSSATTFDWMIGTWIRTNEEPGKQTYEIWNKVSSDHYKGRAFTMVQKDTVWSEKVDLMRSSDQWNFAVLGKGEVKPTIFKLNLIQGTRFRCENPQNEFPKIIEYFKRDQNLGARISGGGPTIDFQFKPAK